VNVDHLRATEQHGEHGVEAAARGQRVHHGDGGQKHRVALPQLVVELDDAPAQGVPAGRNLVQEAGFHQLLHVAVAGGARVAQGLVDLVGLPHRALLREEVEHGKDTARAAHAAAKRKLIMVLFPGLAAETSGNAHALRHLRPPF
jgi:hypothetical protein